MAQDAKIELSLEMDLVAGSGSNTIDLVFSAGIVPGTGVLMLGVTPSSTSKNQLTIEQIFELMAGQSWENLIPGPLQYALDIIAFQGLSSTMFIWEDANGKPDFKLASLAVSVGSNKNRPIPKFGPFEEFTFRVIWTILNPTDKSTRSSMANFFAEVQVPNIGTIDVEIIG